MTEFNILIDSARDLTRIEFSGNVTDATISQATKSFYETEITTNVLWDFSNCDVSDLSSNDFTRLIEFAKSYARQRINGKSALVGSDDLAFGLGRMILTMAAFHDYPVESQVFRTVAEALDWLDDDENGSSD